MRFENVARQILVIYVIMVVNVLFIIMTTMTYKRLALNQMRAYLLVILYLVIHIDFLNKRTLVVDESVHVSVHESFPNSAPSNVE